MRAHHSFLCHFEPVGRLRAYLFPYFFVLTGSVMSPCLALPYIFVSTGPVVCPCMLFPSRFSGFVAPTLSFLSLSRVELFLCPSRLYPSVLLCFSSSRSGLPELQAGIAIGA